MARFNQPRLWSVSVVLILSLLQFGCSKKLLAETADTSLAAGSPAANPVEPPPVSNPPSSSGSGPALGNFKPEPLAWEPARTEGKAWSEYVYKVIKEEAFATLDKASDLDIFCPAYYALKTEEKINVWGAILAGVAKYESSFNPTTRFKEPGMGTDGVTKQPVYSEGLLQLSYQDTQWYKFCEFDWSKDKNLAVTSPQKTIFDPYKNLRCGILILAQQVKRSGKVVLSSGVYWSTLRSGNGKVTEISAITKKIKFCK